MEASFGLFYWWEGLVGGWESLVGLNEPGWTGMVGYSGVFA